MTLTESEIKTQLEAGAEHRRKAARHLERAVLAEQALAWCRGRIDFLERHGTRPPRVNTCGHPAREHVAHGQCWPCYYAANKDRYAKHTKALQARRRAQRGERP